jgi:hypothetical protein
MVRSDDLNFPIQQDSPARDLALGSRFCDLAAEDQGISSGLGVLLFLLDDFAEFLKVGKGSIRHQFKGKRFGRSDNGTGLSQACDSYTNFERVARGEGVKG